MNSVVEQKWMNLWLPFVVKKSHWTVFVTEGKAVPHLKKDLLIAAGNIYKGNKLPLQILRKNMTIFCSFKYCTLKIRLGPSGHLGQFTIWWKLIFSLVGFNGKFFAKRFHLSHSSHFLSWFLNYSSQEQNIHPFTFTVSCKLRKLSKTLACTWSFTFTFLK